MQGQAKSPKKKWGWLWLLVGVLVIVVLIAPLIRGFSLQWRSGKVIRAYVDEFEASEIIPTKGNFYCLLPSFYDMPRSEELDQAIVWLNEARSLAPRNVYSNFLLGQAYCLKQEYQQAIDAFDGFLTERPENRLAKAESGFAAVAIAQSITDPQNAQAYRSTSLQFLEDAGFSANSFENLGDTSFKKEKYQDSLVWYEMSDFDSSLQDQRLFRYALLELVFKDSALNKDQIKESMVLELDGHLTIEPTDLFLLSSGSSVPTRNEGDRAVGILYSNSQDAGILFRVSEANKYCLFGQALDKQPVPTQIGVDIDFETQKVVDLVNGNGDWLDFGFGLVLDAGLHILTVKLMNDAIVNGVDRNAYISAFNINLCE